MLQQTRVAAVIPFYERFLKRFPTAAALAKAPESDVLTLWAGLGYYSRARNLHKAARRIVELGGFPSSFEQIRQLPGVGDYTAAAVSSIAFDQPHAAVDGNVLRVLSRFTAEPGDIGATAVRRRLAETANQLLDPKRPGEFNQALMELGALICLPREPQCGACPLSADCRAFSQGRQREFPIKLRKPSPVITKRTLLLIRRGGRILLRRRGPEESPMAGFWELPEAAQLPQAELRGEIASFRHTIMQHLYEVEVAEARIRSKPRGYVWLMEDDLDEIPLSTMARKALRALEL